MTKILRPGVNQGALLGLTATQFLGAFNDNLFKMVVSLIGVSAALDSEAGGGFLSLTTVIFILPYLLFFGQAGWLADTVAKGRVLLWTKLAEIAVMAIGWLALALSWSGLALIGLFLMSVQATFFSPAKYGVLPELVTSARLPQANGYLEVSRYLAIITGTAVGGLLMQWLEGKSAAIGAIMFGIAVLGVLTVLPVCRSGRVVPRAAYKATPWRLMALGLARLGHRPWLRAAVVGLTLFELLSSLLLMDLLLAGKQVASWSDGAIGLLGAAAGIGAGGGALLAGLLSGQRIELALVPLGAIGITVMLTTLSVVFPNWYACAVAILCLGIFGGLVLVPLNAFIQRRSSPTEKGLVIATNNFLNMLGVFFSAVILWTVSDLAGIGADNVLSLAAALAACVTLGAMIAIPALRNRLVVWLQRQCSGLVNLVAGRGGGQLFCVESPRRN